MDIRQLFFKNRSFSPIPLALAIIYFAIPSWSFMILGGLLIFLGETIRINAVRYAGGATRTRKVGAPSICSDGPYARVRNPLYLGNMVIYGGVVLFAGGTMVWPLLVLTLIFFLIQYGFIISLEEEILYEKFLTEYDVYRGAVPRLIPKISPWKKRTVLDPLSWSMTLRTESRSLQSLTATIIIILLRSYIPI